MKSVSLAIGTGGGRQRGRQADLVPPPGPDSESGFSPHPIPGSLGVRARVRALFAEPWSVTSR